MSIERNDRSDLVVVDDLQGCQILPVLLYIWSVKQPLMV